MIEVSLHPDVIPHNQVTEIVLRLTNREPGDCTNVHFSFRLPLKVLLVQGRREVQLPRLEKGQHYDHPIRVQAREEGAFYLESVNLSYRDPAGQSRRIPEPTIPFRVVAPARPSVPTLELTLETASLPAGEWRPLRGHIANLGEVPALKLVLLARGPSLEADQTKVGELLPGETRPFTLSVCAKGVGTHVPIRLEATFQDNRGQSHHCAWRRHLEVARPAEEKEWPIPTHGPIIIGGEIHVGEISTGKTETYTETHIGDVGMMKEVQFGGGGGGVKEEPRRRFCPGCGEALPAEGGVRFCPSCGRPL